MTKRKCKIDLNPNHIQSSSLVYNRTTSGLLTHIPRPLLYEFIDDPGYVSLYRLNTIHHNTFINYNYKQHYALDAVLNSRKKDMNIRGIKSLYLTFTATDEQIYPSLQWIPSLTCLDLGIWSIDSSNAYKGYINEYLRSNSTLLLLILGQAHNYNGIYPYLSKSLQVVAMGQHYSLDRCYPDLHIPIPLDSNIIQLFVQLNNRKGKIHSSREDRGVYSKYNNVIGYRVKTIIYVLNEIKSTTPSYFFKWSHYFKDRITKEERQGDNIQYSYSIEYEFKKQQQIEAQIKKDEFLQIIETNRIKIFGGGEVNDVYKKIQRDLLIRSPMTYDDIIQEYNRIISNMI